MQRLYQLFFDFFHPGFDSPRTVKFLGCIDKFEGAEFMHCLVTVKKPRQVFFVFSGCLVGGLTFGVFICFLMKDCVGGWEEPDYLSELVRRG